MRALYDEFESYLRVRSDKPMQDFIRGQRARLSQLAPAARRFALDVRVQSASAAFDFVCFGLDDRGKLSDDRFMVFFNQKTAPANAIELRELAGKSARFEFELDALPATIARLVFTISVDGAGAMRDLGASEVTLQADGEAVARYPFSGADFDKEGALMLAEIYRKDGAWRFWASGQGFAGDLSALLQHFGGQEASDNASAQTPSPSQSQLQSQSQNVAPLSTPAPIATPPSAPISDPAISSSPVNAPTVVPAAPMGELQKTLDGAPVGATIQLPRGEYRGPITVARALTIEGEGAVIWSRNGPVVAVKSGGVTLRGVQIEVTDGTMGAPDADVALQVEGEAPRLQNVGVRGRVVGVPHEAMGEWRLPDALDLGEFAPRALNSWTFEIAVPVECALKTGVSGLQVKPARVAAGAHQIEIVAQNIGPDTFLAGQIEVEHGGIARPIPLSGRAGNAGVSPVTNRRLGVR